MSRHTIASNCGSYVVVGWDAPMETYFAQEFEFTGVDMDNDPIEEIVWECGTKIGELKSIDELEARLAERKVATLTAELKQTLAAEQAAQPRMERSPAMQKFLDDFAARFLQ